MFVEGFEVVVECVGGEKLGLRLNSAKLGLEDWTELCTRQH